MRTVEKEGIEVEPRMMRVRNPVTGRNELVSEMTYSEWLEWKKALENDRTLKTPGNIGEKAIPYSVRGIDLEDRIQTFAQKLNRDGDYIADRAGTFRIQDLAILTAEYGVEYTLLTIGSTAYLIRGDEKGTTIPQKLVEMLLESKGTLDCHSHPYIGDLIPSMSDKDFLKMLTWQKDSIIIDPTQSAYRYSAHGFAEPLTTDVKRESDYYSAFFEGEGE